MGVFRLIETVLWGLLLLSLTLLAVLGLSRRARVLAAAIIGGTIAFEIWAVIAYRHSTEGQTGIQILWAAIPFYGLALLGLLHFGDKAHRTRRRNHRLG